MNWQSFEDLDPSFSGYAWVAFQNQYAEGKPWWEPSMCRIWVHHTSKTKWWSGWDLESNSSLNPTWAPSRVMLIEKPGKPE